MAAAVTVAALSGGPSGGPSVGGQAAAAVPVGTVDAGPVHAGTVGAGTVDARTVDVGTVHAAGAAAVAAGPASSAPAAASTAPAKAVPADLAGAPPARLVVPDLIASAPGGLSRADLDRIGKLGGVRAVLPVDGARITVNGAPLTVIAAAAAALRPWTPPATAASAPAWSAFAAGDLVTTAPAAAAARLARGGEYPVAAAVRARITDGGTALVGVAGIDGIVSAAEGKKLGLLRNAAVLVNAPAADMTALAGQLRAALGRGARVVRLVPAAAPARLPVDTAPPAGRPASYLQLFQESAARYCPGLSWTVLAAIGQIESGDGRNLGPSTAGARGPMQFLPSTWAVWGIDGFGDTGPPDILNPFDAVPSAARLLCADGAVTGSAGLRQAIFDYNHATWYVDEVLALAEEYAHEY